DFNPRVGATFRLFEGQNGMDVVRAMYLHITGQTVPPSRICEGKKWIVEDLELSSLFHYFRDAALSFRDCLRSLRGICETAWFDCEDTGHFLQLCASIATRPFLGPVKKTSWSTVPE